MAVAHEEDGWSAVNRRPRLICVALFSMLMTSAVLGQQPAQAQPASPPARRALLRSSPVSASAAPLYQRSDTWYEFLLKQFNPDDIDYGTWMEQRRQAFLDASLRNPYFNYSAGVTLALLVLAMLYAKRTIDHRRSMWITAEMMTDLYDHDAYSRQVAREAIQKYNDHIERCNRAMERAEHGLAAGGTDSEADRFRAELQAVTAERDSYKRERDLAKNDLAEKERLLADMSLRLDALAKKSDANRHAPSAVDLRTADQRLVEHINNLQEQLYAERRENKRLKGA
jgi:hypothetical protein